MNLTQIKAAYTANLNEKLAYCFNKIEEEMISRFRIIEQGEDIAMSEQGINQYSNSFSDEYKDDMIKGIKERYAENWDVSYVPANKKQKDHFVFAYKGEQAGFASHIVHSGTIIVSKEEPIENRNDILDL